MFRQQQMVQCDWSLKGCMGKCERWSWTIKKVLDHPKHNILNSKRIFFHYKPPPNFTYLSVGPSISLLPTRKWHLQVCLSSCDQSSGWVFSIFRILLYILFYFHYRHTTYHLIAGLFQSCIKCSHFYAFFKINFYNPLFYLVADPNERRQWYFISYRITSFLGLDFNYIILFSKCKNLKPTSSH